MPERRYPFIQNEDVILEERLAELESRIAFQDNTIEELNDLITKQQFQISHLEKNMKMLMEQLKALTQPLIAPENEETPPPHY